MPGQLRPVLQVTDGRADALLALPLTLAQVLPAALAQRDAGLIRGCHPQLPLAEPEARGCIQPAPQHKLWRAGEQHEQIDPVLSDVSKEALLVDQQGIVLATLVRHDVVNVQALRSVHDADHVVVGVGVGAAVEARTPDVHAEHPLVVQLEVPEEVPQQAGLPAGPWRGRGPARPQRLEALELVLDQPQARSGVLHGAVGPHLRQLAEDVQRQGLQACAALVRLGLAAGRDWLARVQHHSVQEPRVRQLEGNHVPLQGGPCEHDAGLQKLREPAPGLEK
mmetsp:Transcript_101314/g.287132  ORF Transcript_101314/g.287132 Transcript_101314/m.287132 type:complete len:279 (+) Transcript_101314:240-1076(+)